MQSSIYFYKDRPLFGMDIGSSSIKVMQLEAINGQQPSALGYGVAEFDSTFIKNGVLDNLEGIASSIYNLFNNAIIGKISTRRVALSLPAAYASSRIISLPKSIDLKDIPDVVTNEIQSYLPSQIGELYSDYSILEGTKTQHHILTAAAPKRIIDSYMNLAAILNLEVVAIEPTTGASNRLFGYTDKHKTPSVLIDFGALSTDITIYDQNLVVTGTVDGGGNQHTKAIQQALEVTDKEAYIIKTKYGLNRSKRQSEIREAIKPFLDELTKEVRRMIRYYEERVSEQGKKIGQIITLGGGSNMPGLSDFLTEALRLPVRTYDPWSTILFDKVTPPDTVSQSQYATAAGLALTNQKEALV